MMEFILFGVTQLMFQHEQMHRRQLLQQLTVIPLDIQTHAKL